MYKFVYVQMCVSIWACMYIYLYAYIQRRKDILGVIPQEPSNTYFFLHLFIYLFILDARSLCGLECQVIYTGVPASFRNLLVSTFQVLILQTHPRISDTCIFMCLMSSGGQN